MELARLSRGGHPIAVTLPDIRVETTLMIWNERDVPRGTGRGMCFIRVSHHRNVQVPSTLVEEWLMATFPRRRLLAEQLRVTEIVPVEVREQDRVLTVNVFHQVLVLFTQPPVQT